MIKSSGQPGYRVRYRPGEVRSTRRGRRSPGFQDFFVGITRAAYWAGLGVLLVYAAYQSWVLFWETSYFRVQEVGIAGNQVLQKQDILKLTKIELGSHFFRYQPESIRQSLLAHPRILSVKVEQATPKTINIQVVENRPVAKTIIDSTLQEVGEDGRILGAADTVSTTLPLLLGLPEVHRDTGGVRRVAPEVFNQIPSWLAALKGSLLADFESIDFHNPFRVEVKWRGMRVFVSEPQDVKEMGPVEATLHDAERRRVCVQTMDLRFRMLVVKYGSTPAAPVTSPTTWTEVAQAPMPETTPAPPIEPAAALATPATTELALTSHPAVQAAATTTGTTLEPDTTAMFSPDELRALEAAPPTVPATAEMASKPAFEPQTPDADPEEAPDPAYIYNPPEVLEDEEASRPAPRRARERPPVRTAPDLEAVEDGN